MAVLTPKQQGYVAARVAGASPAEAYRLAYDAENMSPASIANEANDLEKHPKIAPMLARAQERVMERAEITAEDIARVAWEIANHGKVEVARVSALTLLSKRHKEFSEKHILSGDPENPVTIERRTRSTS